MVTKKRAVSIEEQSEKLAQCDADNGTEISKLKRGMLIRILCEAIESQERIIIPLHKQGQLLTELTLETNVQERREILNRFCAVHKGKPNHQQ